VERYSQHREHASIARALRRSRAFRARQQKRRRRSVLLAAGAALAVAVGFEFSVASFGGMSVAEAAANQAKSLMSLIDQRSPGERTAGELIKTKRKALADRELAAPKPVVPKNLAEVLAPAPAELVEVAAPPAELASVVPVPPGAILLPPSGGGGILPPPGGGVVPPGGGDTPPGGGDTPPGGGDTPPGGGDTPPPLPEPGTWMTMILGFGLIGWTLRRKRPVPALS
jgi:hypothetical protein